MIVSRSVVSASASCQTRQAGQIVDDKIDIPIVIAGHNPRCRDTHHQLHKIMRAKAGNQGFVPGGRNE
jgi:hypothetical protein